ncbi:MAG: hypothetical protein ABI091_26865 [Ferruginibacter sp.]
MKNLFYVLLLTFFTSCKATNKTHWQRIHPYGGWAGNNYIPGDSSKKINLTTVR